MKNVERIRGVLLAAVAESPADDELLEFTEDLSDELDGLRRVLRSTLSFIKEAEPPGGPEWYRWRDVHNALEDIC